MKITLTFLILLLLTTTVNAQEVDSTAQPETF
jgi:hypothetical protein